MATSDSNGRNRAHGPTELSLDVDDQDHPKLVILVRGRFEILGILSYRPLPELEHLLLGAVAPHEVSITRSLISALSAKLASRTKGWAA